MRERSLMSRFARSAPTQATEIDDTAVEILVVRDGHSALASTNRLDDDALRDTARRADAAARASARSGEGNHPGLAPAGAAAPPAGADGFDADTARLDPARAGAALGRAFGVAAEHGLEAFGVWTAGAVRTAIAATSGLRLDEEVTDAFMKVICRNADGRSGFASATATAAGAIDPGDVARRAARKVGGEPLAELGPGEYPVVLEPAAVGVLLDFLGALAHNGLTHAEGRGALSGRLGTTVAAPSIDLRDDAADPATLPRRFDFEGTPKQPRRPHRGRRRDRRRARPALRGARRRRARAPPATPPSPAARPTAPPPPTSCSPAATPPASTTSSPRSSAAST